MALPRASFVDRSRLLPFAGVEDGQECGICCEQTMVRTSDADMRALRCSSPVLLGDAETHVSFRIDHAEAACSMRKGMARRSHFPSLYSPRVRAGSIERSDALLGLQPCEGQPVDDQLEGIATQTFRPRLPTHCVAAQLPAHASRLERLNSELTDSAETALPARVFPMLSVRRESANVSGLPQ